MIKPKTRLPRFRRDAVAIRNFALTTRDKEIIRQVERFRFLRSRQICRLVEGAIVQILRHLQRIYHHGYLEKKS